MHFEPHYEGLLEGNTSKRGVPSTVGRPTVTRRCGTNGHDCRLFGHQINAGRLHFREKPSCYDRNPGWKYWSGSGRTTSRHTDIASQLIRRPAMLHVLCTSNSVAASNRKNVRDVGTCCSIYVGSCYTDATSSRKLRNDIQASISIRLANPGCARREPALEPQRSYDRQEWLKDPHPH